MILGLVAFVPPALLGVAGHFDGLYGQYPFAYYDYAVGPLRDSLARLSLPTPPFWPLGYPLLIVVASLVVGRTPLAGQVVALTAAALVPVFTFLLARAMVRFEKEESQSHAIRVATVSGLLVALTGQLWQSGFVVMADTPALAAATLSAWALARYGLAGRLPWLVLAAAALACAILTQWAYALLVLPWAVFLVLCAARSRAWRRSAVHGAVAVAIGTVILAPELALTVLHRLRYGAATYAADLQIYTWNPLNAFRREFDTHDGHLAYRLPNGLYYALWTAHWFAFTPFVVPLIAVGLWMLAQRRAWMPVALLAGWPAVIYTVRAGAPGQNFRFILAYIPPLAILIGLGFDWLLAALAPRWRIWALGALAAVLVVRGITGAHLCQTFIDRKNGDVETARWVEAQTPTGSTLLAFSLTLTFQHYSGLKTLELFYQTRADLQALAASGRPAYLLVDVRNMETQWRDRPLGANYRWLRDGPGLIALGEHRGYTLFRVGDQARSPSRRSREF